MKNIKKAHSDMVAKLKKPGQEIIDSLTPQKVDLLHMAIGISGEVAELHGSEDRENAVEGYGDLLFYIRGAFQVLGIDAPYKPKFQAEDLTDSGMHVGIGLESLVLQSGSFLDEAKKITIYGNHLGDFEITSLTLCLQHIRGITRFLMRMAGISINEALEYNMEKLGDRYKDHNYSDEQALDRADKKPRNMGEDPMRGGNYDPSL